MTRFGFDSTLRLYRLREGGAVTDTDTEMEFGGGVVGVQIAANDDHGTGSGNTSSCSSEGLLHEQLYHQ